MLSDDEIWTLWNSQGVDDMNQKEADAFARAIEAAVFTMANVLADSRARRIATLESTLKVALEALERIGNWGGTTRYVGNGSYTDIARVAVEQCKEVLHAD